MSTKAGPKYASGFNTECFDHSTFRQGVSPANPTTLFREVYGAIRSRCRGFSHARFTRGMHGLGLSTWLHPPKANLSKGAGLRFHRNTQQYHQQLVVRSRSALLSAMTRIHPRQGTFEHEQLTHFVSARQQYSEFIFSSHRTSYMQSRFLKRQARPPWHKSLGTRALKRLEQ